MLSWAALGEVHVHPMSSPAPCCPPAPREEPHPRDEAAQCRADTGDAEPIQTALCLPARCNQGRGRNNSLRTCSQSMSPHKWSPCLCPGRSPLATHVRGVKHKPCAASCVLRVPLRRTAGRAAWGPGFIPHSRWPQDTAGLPTHFAAHPSQNFPQASWFLHEGLFPGH